MLSPGSTTMASPEVSSPRMVQLHWSGPTGKVSRIMVLLSANIVRAHACLSSPFLDSVGGLRDVRALSLWFGRLAGGLQALGCDAQGFGEAFGRECARGIEEPLEDEPGEKHVEEGAGGSRSVLADGALFLVEKHGG